MTVTDEKTMIGIIRKEEFINEIFYFLDIPFEGCIFVDTEKVPDVEKYIDKRVEVSVIVWDYTQKRTADRYKVTGIIDELR